MVNMSNVLVKMAVESKRIDIVHIFGVDMPGLYYMTQKKASFSCRRYTKMNKDMILNPQRVGDLSTKHTIIFITVWRTYITLFKAAFLVQDATSSSLSYLY